MTEPQKMGSVDDGFKSSALDALRCLYIAVDSSIADDVNKRVMRYTDKLHEQIRTFIADRDALALRVKTLEGAMTLQNSCVVCTALLLPNDQAPHCEDCVVDENDPEQAARIDALRDCIVSTIKESK